MEKIVVGLGAVVLNENSEVVLVKHKKPTPWHGSWIIPGGAWVSGESLEQGVKRELLEELGLEIKVEKLLTVFESYESVKGKTNGRVILVSYLAKAKKESLNLKIDEVKDAKWFTKFQLGKLKIHQDSVQALKLANLL